MQKTIQSFVLVALMLTTSCRQAPQITIINRTQVPLTQVIASGQGFSEAVGTIPPGDQRQIIAHPHGESGLQLKFTANGKAFVSPETGYFEGHYPYEITATVKPDFTVTVDSQL